MNWAAAELSLMWGEPILLDDDLESKSFNDWTVVPLGWTGDYNRENANELRPAADMAVHGQPLRAMVDTGSTLTKLTADDASAFHVVNATAVRQVRGVARRLLVRTPLRFANLVHYLEATLDTTRGRQDIGNANIIGMNLLLQHAAVCFSWYESMLYLGQLGPCAAGEPAAESGLTASFLPFVRLRTSRNNQGYHALVDTGADASYCSPAMYRATADDFLTFGGDPSMSVLCQPFVSNPLGDPSIQAIVGNETFQRFRAFGWTRSPFQLYFVRTPDNVLPTHSGG